MKKTIYDERYIALVLWLKQKRTEKKITMRELSAQMGCSYAFISKYEKNQVRLDILQYFEICTLLEVDPSDGFRQLGT